MAAPMFGIIVAGRLVQTDFQNIDSTKFAMNIQDADSVNHIVVFFDRSPTISRWSWRICWPDPNAAPSWQLLGFITNMKPSAIFKITKLKPEQLAYKSQHITTPFGVQPISQVAQIGISIEPLQQLELQTPVPQCTPSNANTFMEFTNKMLENFFNYIASYAAKPSQIIHSNSENFVPLNTVQQWYVNFQRRLEQNPNFWKN